jgi:hypothetical protein
MYSDHLIIYYQLLMLPATRIIDYNEILEISEYERKIPSLVLVIPLVYHELEKYPYFNITSSDKQLYHLKINEEEEKGSIPVILDIDDIQLFKDIIYNKKREIRLECPNCKKEFKITNEIKEIKCPNCGVSGSIER